MIRSALIRERVMAEAIRMCKVMQVQFPHQFPDEREVYNVLQERGERDLAILITLAVMMAFGEEPSECKDPRFDKVRRAADAARVETSSG